MQQVIPSRAISDYEASVVRAALQRAGKNVLLDYPVEALVVVAKCDCGCASVDFSANGTMAPYQIVADGRGTTPLNNEVGVIVWGTVSSITGLEIYCLSNFDDMALPLLDTIQ